MSMRRLTVFLSSTGQDLAEYRRAIIDHMRPLDGFICDCMEDFGARDASAVAFCQDRVRNADVLVGVVGHHRGWEPAGDNKQRSITELEYEWAVDADRPRLMYVSPTPASGAAVVVDAADACTRQQAFRARVLSGNVCDSRFLNGQRKDPADLAAAVMTALANVQYRQMLARIQDQDRQAETVTASLKSKRSFWSVLLGKKPPTDDKSVSPSKRSPPLNQPTTPEGGASSATDQDPASALAAFAHDADLDAIMRDPAKFDVAKLEAAVVARAERRRAEANQIAENAAEKRRAAAADYKHLAELTGWYDVRKARNYFQRAVEADPDDYVAWGEYGDRCVTAGDLTEAMRAYRATVPIIDRLAKSDPGNAGWQRDLSVSYDRVGDVQVAQGQLGEALVSFKDGLAIADKLAKSDPGNAGWQRDLSVSYDRVGDVQVAQGQLGEARVSFKDGLAIADKLAKSDPGNAGWQRDLSVSYNKVGNCRSRKANSAMPWSASRMA